MKNFIRKWNAREYDNRYKLAMEYGIILSETAKEKGEQLTQKQVIKAEKMFVSECERCTDSQLAINMIPNILSIFETS